jgi:hypothetical protein
MNLMYIINIFPYRLNPNPEEILGIPGKTQNTSANIEYEIN